MKVGCSPAGRCSLASIVWSLATWILLLHLYSSFYPPPHSSLSDSYASSRRLPMYSEFEEYEEKEAQLKSPLPRGRRRGNNPSNRPHRVRNISAAEDFVNPYSLKRPLYFPDKALAVNPLQSPDFDKYQFYPGREWLDTDGKPIQAHGGGILYVQETKTFYWYGENKDGRTYRLQKRSLARVIATALHVISGFVSSFDDDLWVFCNYMAYWSHNQSHDCCSSIFVPVCLSFSCAFLHIFWTSEWDFYFHIHEGIGHVNFDS